MIGLLVCTTQHYKDKSTKKADVNECKLNDSNKANNPNFDKQSVKQNKTGNRLTVWHYQRQQNKKCYIYNQDDIRE